MGRVLVRSAAPLNIASLALDGYLRGFEASPWDGTESDGPSGSRPASNGSSPPTIGTPLNGHGVAHFDGANDFLSLAGDASDYMADETVPADGSFSGYVLFRASSAGTYDIVEPYKERAILSDNSGSVGLTFSTEGFGAFHAALVGGWKSVRAACSVDAWHVGTFAYDAGAMRLAVGVDGPPNHTVFIQPADASLSLRTLFIGKNFNATAHFAGDIAELAITREQLSSDTFRGIVRAVNRRYGLSLSQPSNASNVPVTGAPSAASSYVGTLHTSAAAFSQRDGAKHHYLSAHNKYFLLGGWASAPRVEFGNEQTTNQVYTAVPGALSTWTQALAHSASPAMSGAGARFTRAHAFGSCQFDLGDGAGECVYVVGSDQYVGGFAQVWRSSNPGSNTGWERRHAAADFGPFTGLCVGQFGTEIHVVGGCPIEASTFYSASAQHWVSRDGGTSWHRLADCPFATSFLTQLIEHRDLLFVIGGNGGAIAAGTRVYQNAVWAWDGSVWHLQNADPDYPGAMWLNGCSYDGNLWRIMGRFADGGGDDDSITAYSGDLGATWTTLPSPPWASFPSHADGVAVGPDGIVIASGFGVDRRVFSLVAT